ncbi:transposase [Candidatus Gracilibacteria bacterium]|nr:transposase [Candidatus Gracilibacteria bacterium]
MSNRLHAFINNEIYHIYNRGNSKQVIYQDAQDHEYFINLLLVMNTEKRVASRVNKVKDIENIVDIGAYCLMPNHFHIMIKQQKDDGIILFMRKVSTAYAMYYNKKYKRTGGLFEGRFKSKHIGEDRYLKYLFSYIHLNPLKLLDENWKTKARYPSIDMFKFLTLYMHSSFGEYYRNEEIVINKKAFPDYFPTTSSFIKELVSWFSLGEK